MAVNSLPGGRPDRLFVSDKDPDYYYRWMNQRDMNIMSAQMDGYQPVIGEDPMMKLIPLPTGQSTENPSGGVVRQRGDLILMRIRKEAHEEIIGARDREARERQSASLDTMVHQANDNARKALHERGQKNIPAQMVFRDE